MKRSSDLRSGLRAAAAAVFFAAALLSTGCSNNALLNPQADQVVQGGQTANGAGHELDPAGHELDP